MEFVKKTFSEQIYESLRLDIINKKIGLGEKLVNRDLQEKFGVSSTPIRDAINHLYQDGLITEVSKVGARVVTLDTKTAREVNEILSILSCAAIELSFVRSDPRLVVSVQLECIDMQRANVNNDQYFSYDYKFHKTFFDFAENDNCKGLFKRYNALHELLVHYYYDKNNSKLSSIDEHNIIIDLYGKGEMEAAKKEMSNHYTSAIRCFEQEISIG